VISKTNDASPPNHDTREGEPQQAHVAYQLAKLTDSILHDGRHIGRWIIGSVRERGSVKIKGPADFVFRLPAEK